MILDMILDFGLGENYFSKKSIKNIEKSCCDLEQEIIDFDETKEIICKEANQITRKSCDGLCLSKSIIFIEFKSIKKFFEGEYKYKLKNNNEDEIIKSKAKDFNFEKKIEDSLWLFDYIVKHRKLQLSNNQQNTLKNCNKYYYIVKDTNNPLININITLNLLALNRSIETKELKMDIEINNQLSKITIINKVELIDCDKLQEILKKDID